MTPLEEWRHIVQMGWVQIPAVLHNLGILHFVNLFLLGIKHFSNQNSERIKVTSIFFPISPPKHHVHYLVRRKFNLYNVKNKSKKRPILKKSICHKYEIESPFPLEVNSSIWSLVD